MNSEVFTILLVVGVVAIALLIGVAVSRKRNLTRTHALREHFGPEYERALELHGDRTRAEKELMLRQRRVERFHLRLLSPQHAEQFSAAWASVQQLFVDDPSGAVVAADRLVKEVMIARGYPMADFEQRVADLSVEHTKVVQNYRSARAIALANADGRAETEELRQAMVHYRALFTDLLQAPAPYAATLSEARA